MSFFTPFPHLRLQRFFIIFPILALCLARLAALEEMPITKVVPETAGTAELAACRLFSEPVWPAGGNPTPAENEALRQLLLSASNLAPFSNGLPDLMAGMNAYLRDFPDSPWNPSLRLNLGMMEYREGYFSRALVTLNLSRTGFGNPTHPRAKALADRALGEYLILNSKLGRFEVLNPLLETIAKQEVNGMATELVSGARAGLGAMNGRPETAFRCGPMALYQVMKSLDPENPNGEMLREAESTRKGTSLWQNYKLALRAGIALRPARRQPGAAIPLPAVVHWKSGHFAAITEMKNGRYHIKDGTFEDSLSIRPEALEDEASGWFLIPDNGGDLPPGWSAAGELQADEVWGRGYVYGYDKDATGRCDTSIGCGGDSRKMAIWNAHLLAVSLNISDTPVSYAPPFGPAPDLTITYNQREANQPSVFAYPNFGPKWTAGWISAIIDDPNDEGADVKHYLPGGGAERYEVYQYHTNEYDLQRKSLSLLKRSGASSYILTHRDGTVDIFDSPDGSVVWPRRVFMTSRTDTHGNSLSYTWDANGRLTQIKDSLDQTTLVAYDDSAHPLRITKVTDPFSREANFGYDGLGRLKSITDPEGIVSEFTYGTSDFIETLTTPYGDTGFEFGEELDDPDPDVDSDTRRWLLVTDPAGQKQRVEYRHEAPGIAADDFPLPSPRSEYGSDELDGVIATRTSPSHYRQYRNTFYWDTKTMRSINNDATGNYGKAHIYQWLHSENTPVTESVLESEKPPLQNRIYYNYQHQYYPSFHDWPALISKIASAIDHAGGDSGTSRISQFEYNNSGNPTRSIDPAGREIERVYAANDYDVMEVRRKVGEDSFGSPVWQTLRSFSDYVNRLPAHMTDGSGQTTDLAWNSRGQLKSVTDADDDTTTYTYDHRLNFDPANDTASGYGYLYKISGPVAGSETTFTYDSAGRPRTVTDSEDYSVTMEYDDLDRLVKTIYPDATTEEIVYGRRADPGDSSSAIVPSLDPYRSTDRLGRSTTYLYNSIRQLMVATDAEKRITQYDYCSCGAINRLVDPNGNVTRWKYDIQGRITDKIFPDESTVTYRYDPDSGRLESTTDALGQTTEHTYFIDDNPDTISFPNAIHPTASISWEWDPRFDRPTKLTDGTGTTQWTYHPYDGSTLGAGQIDTIDGPLTDDSITRIYDKLGRSKNRTIHGSANSLTRGFDALGRLESESNTLGAFGYQYLNQTSQPEDITYPDGQSTHFGYKPNSEDRRLDRIEHRLSGSGILAAHEYGYDADGTIETWKQERSALPARTWHFGYDNATRLTSAVAKNPAEAVLESHGWQYDPGDNRIATETPAGIVPSKHNELNQLLNQGTGPLRFAGTLDNPGTVTVNGDSAKMRDQTLFEAYLELPPGTSQVEIEAIDFSNNITTETYEVTVASAAATDFGYDANGNTTSRTTVTGNTSYEWDALDRLTAINHENGTRSEFQYDGLSRRVRILEKDATQIVTSDKRFVWDGLEIAEERAADGQTVLKRFYPQGVEILTGPFAGTYTYRTDHLGSVREVIDSTGTLTARYDYTTWGELQQVSGTFDLDFGYTGHYHHQPSGLLLAPYRAYDPEAARWLSADPIGESGGMNLYGYVSGNPVNSIDMLGFFGIPTITNSVIGYPNAMNSNYEEQFKQVDLEAGKMAAENLACMAAGGAVGAGIGKAVQAAGLAQTANATVTVTRWGRPGLEAGDWVMKGGNTLSNYLRSFKWQPGAGNDFAARCTGKAYEVAKEAVKWPKGWGIDGWWKGLFGQRIYKP